MSIAVRSVLSDGGYHGIEVEFDAPVNVDNVEKTAVMLGGVVAASKTRITSTTITFRNPAWPASTKGATYALSAGLYTGYAGGDTDTVDGQPLSVKERIERRIVAILSKLTGCGKVYRWDGRGLRDPDTGTGKNAADERVAAQPGDCLVIPLDESAEDAGDGGGGAEGTTLKKLPLQIQIVLALAEDDPVNESDLVNRRLLDLEATITADPKIAEAAADGGTMLAIDLAVTDILHPPRDQYQREITAGIQIEIQYQHNRDDPTIGPGIALRTI